MQLLSNDRMHPIAAPTELGDAWSRAFDGKTSIEAASTVRPFGGVFVEQPCVPSNTSLWRPLDRISVWVTAMESVTGEPAPPALEWEIWARTGNAHHRLASVSLAALSWGHRGMLVQCTSVLAQGFELYARSLGQPVRANVMVLVDRSGLPVATVLGDGVTVLP
ncbi:MAG: hypothetical protein Q8Q09_02720 [Deltaproteobacteria bacterium]|nr:hypothetical protein [Deltaproteobacteria bacterium]